MILENQTPEHKYFSQSYNQLSSVKIFNLESSHESEISRMRSEYKNQICIRDRQRIKSQKRKALLTNQTIQQIFDSDLPKQSEDAKNWAFNLIELFQNSKIYEPDAHRLREIFLVAQRFPCLGTLRLFYLFILNANTKNVQTLFDMDVWKFLHNILEFPNVKQNKAVQVSMNDQYQISQGLNNVNKKFVEVQMVQAAIQTLVLFYKKSNKFRDFSIDQHKTFRNYILPAYKKYQQLIKTEVINFVKEVFFFRPSKLSDQYKYLTKFIFDTVLDYKDKFSLYFKEKKWNQYDIRESLIEVVKRSALLMEAFERVLNFAKKTPWFSKMLQSYSTLKNFCYLNIIDGFLEFGEDILPQILFNDSTPSQIAEYSVNFIYNTIKVYQKFNEYNTDIIQSPSYIPSIMRRIVWALYFLEKCDESKIFNSSGIKLLSQISTARTICLFVIDNALNSEFDKYSLFVRSFTFYEMVDGTEVNLLEILNYSLKTQYKQEVLSEIYRVIFSYLNQEVIPEDLPRFHIVTEMIQAMIYKLGDIFTTEQTKMGICHGILQFNQKSGTLGTQLKIAEVMEKNFAVVEDFMNTQRCNLELFNRLELVKNWIKDLCQNPNEKTIII